MSRSATGEPPPLHPLEFRILLELCEDARHGYAVVRAIEEREGGRRTIYPANLYRRIRDLVARGLVEQTPTPPGTDETEARRKYFRATDLGLAAARLEARRLQELVGDASARGLLEKATG